MNQINHPANADPAAIARRVLAAGGTARQACDQSGLGPDHIARIITATIRAKISDKRGTQS